jgi:hypothetical protein
VHEYRELVDTSHIQPDKLYGKVTAKRTVVNPLMRHTSNFVDFLIFFFFFLGGMCNISLRLRFSSVSGTGAL